MKILNSVPSDKSSFENRSFVNAQINITWDEETLDETIRDFYRFLEKSLLATGKFDSLSLKYLSENAEEIKRNIKDQLIGIDDENIESEENHENSFDYAKIIKI
jgi:hypothetical protein